MILFFLFAALAWGQEAEPTVTELKAELTARDQYIRALETLSTQRLDACFQSYNLLMQQMKLEAQKPPRVEPPKPEGKK